MRNDVIGCLDMMSRLSSGHGALPQLASWPDPLILHHSHREHDGKPRPEERGFASLRLVGVSGLAIELDLIGELDLGEERKHDGDGEL